jgi:DNA-binding beta-propeller fold protein YncE
VHTHELHLDKNDNLYGEHLWYEGEKNNKWGHFVWKYSKNGNFTKEISNTEGFRKNYSFNQDSGGNMYWLENGKLESIFMKKSIDGKVEALVSFKTKDVRWQFCQKNGTFYFVDDNDLYKIENKKVLLVAQDLDDVKGEDPSRKPNNSTFGLWDDKSGNIYVAVMSKEQVRKISTDGKMTIIYKSKVGWIPTGGLFDDKNNLWVLENSATNHVKVVKVSPNDLKGIAIQK